MEIKIKLNEKSLYNSEDEKIKLMSDRQALSTSLLYNYFGFLALFATAVKPVIKEYKSNEKPLIMGAITDDNLDPSLSVKMMMESHYLPASVCNQLLMVLRDIRQSKIIKNTDLDKERIMELFKLCKFDTSNKPKPILLPIVNDYLEGEINLPFIARELYKKSRLPDIQPLCNEFRYYFMNGQYLVLFQRLTTGDEDHPDGVPEQFINDKEKVKNVYKKPVKVVDDKQKILKEKYNKFKDYNLGNTNSAYEYLLPALTFFNETDVNSLSKSEYNKLFEDKEIFNKALYNSFHNRIGTRNHNFNISDVVKVYNLNQYKTVNENDIYKFDNTFKNTSYDNLLNIFKNYKNLLHSKNIVPSTDFSELNNNRLLFAKAQENGHIKEFVLNLSHTIHDADQSLFKLKNGKYTKQKIGTYNRDIHDLSSYITEIKIRNSLSVDDYIEMNDDLPISLQDSNITNDYDTFKYSFYNKWYLDNIEESQLQMSILAEDFMINKSFEKGFYNKTVYECRNGTKNSYDYNVLTKIKEKKKEFLQKIYDDNQKILKEKYGNETIRLYRGLCNIDDPTKYIPSAVESWTDDLESAIFFTEGDKSYIFAIDVPVEYVLANYESVGTSFNVTFPDEREFLLLGGALQTVSLMYDTPDGAYVTLVENNQQKYSDIIDNTSFNSNVRVGMGNDPYEIIMKNKVRGIQNENT